VNRTRVDIHYDHCRMCGKELDGIIRAMGICHDCVFSSARRKKQRIKAPVYAFTGVEENENGES